MSLSAGSKTLVWHPTICGKTNTYCKYTKFKPVLEPGRVALLRLKVIKETKFMPL